jgi:hypothetical protein
MIPDFKGHHFTGFQAQRTAGAAPLRPMRTEGIAQAGRFRIL